MKKILIVEDEQAYLKLLNSQLTEKGYTVIEAIDGRQGLEKVKSEIPDLILLDIMLPGGMNGFDLLEQIKGNVSTKDIPVIVITNLDSEEKVAKIIGASFYFIKSETSVEEIIKKVNQLL